MLKNTLLKVVFLLVVISCDEVFSKNVMVKSGSKLKKTLDSDEEMDLMKSLTTTEDEVNDVEEDEDGLEETDAASTITSASSERDSINSTVSSDELVDYPDTPKTIRDVDILDGTGDTAEDGLAAAYGDGDYKAAAAGDPIARTGTRDEKNATANATTAPSTDNETEAETTETLVQTELYSDNVSVPEEINAAVESWDGENSRRQGENREFVFQPNLNDPAAVARFRTANDEITCRPLEARSTDSNNVGRFMASVAVFTPIILQLTL